MEYLSQILKFNDLLQTNNLSSGQIALWYALMHINNKCQWTEWFQAANRTLEFYSGLSKNGVIKARNVLKQKGLIDFKSNGTSAASFKIKILYGGTESSAESSIDSGIDGGIDSGIDSGTKSGLLNRQRIRPRQRPRQRQVAEEVKEELSLSAAATAADCVLSEYERLIGIPTQNIACLIDGYIEQGMTPELMIRLIEYSVERNARSWQYIEKAIIGNLNDGIKTLDEYNRAKADREQQRLSGQCKSKVSKFNNYDDANSGDYADLENNILDHMLSDDY